MKAGSYLSLARNYSFVIIVLLFIAVDGTRNYVVDNRPIPLARNLFVHAFAENFHWPADLHVGTDYHPDVGGLDSMFYRILDRRKEVLDTTSDSESEQIDVRMYFQGPRPWSFDLRDLELKPDRTGFRQDSNDPLQELRTLQRKAIWKPAQVPPGATELEEAEILRKEIESNAFDRRTSMPGLGLEFRNGTAPWFIALIVLGLTVQIRNQVRRTLLDRELAINEPWLILDGRRGLEKVAAGVWAVTILVAPWIAAGCLIAVLAVDVPLDGWKPLDACIIPLMFVGGWTAITTVGDILRLRRLRLQKIAALRANPT